MRIRLTSDSSHETVTVDIEPGQNIWIETADDDNNGGFIGSLYLADDGATISIGRYSEATQWWEPENPLPVA